MTTELPSTFKCLPGYTLAHIQTHISCTYRLTSTKLVADGGCQAESFSTLDLETLSEPEVH